MSTPYAAQTVAEIYQVIRDAIVNKRIIKGTYQGHAREMCPHVLGRNKRHQEQALFYQFAGSSSSGLGAVGSPNNWLTHSTSVPSNYSPTASRACLAPRRSKPRPYIGLPVYCRMAKS